MSQSDSTHLGCPVCRTAPTTAAELRLERIRNLYEGPHEGYALFRCTACSQMFLEQFQEITWLGRTEDDIWLRWMPLTPDELAEVERLFPEPTEDDSRVAHLAGLMRRRSRLVRDPLGLFAWTDLPWDAGDMFPAG